MAELEPVVLPASVAASHLRACAEALAAPAGIELAELAAVIGHVVSGQRHLAETLDALARRARAGCADPALAAVPTADLAALAEVLQAAATAFGCSAQALTESEPLVETIAETAGGHTRL
ncbi:hypothetical protein SacmaDRAFT_1355 [Saccharomonospora marina XMU15]|uniref:Uncharacterized protein n=1 Tax=Saccharomonospora marina XMU15 TaxID=882083 RepID=H5WZH2_9PSEU|nr:hypothetical protein [Saccharomonospora marina]EHR49634.1 hypothetical protein SacmaDRAFT_1355 [Saccharomonospora marina XMU15]